MPTAICPNCRRAHRVSAAGEYVSCPCGASFDVPPDPGADDAPRPTRAGTFPQVRLWKAPAPPDASVWLVGLVALDAVYFVSAFYVRMYGVREMAGATLAAATALVMNELVPLVRWLVTVAAALRVAHALRDGSEPVPGWCALVAIGGSVGFGAFLLSRPRNQ